MGLAVSGLRRERHLCFCPIYRPRQGGLPGEVHGRRTADNTARVRLPALLRASSKPADVLAAVRNRFRDSVLAAGGGAVSQEDLSEDLRSPESPRNRRDQALMR